MNGIKAKTISIIGLAAGLTASCGLFHLNARNNALANPSFLEFRWDQNSNYRKLYFTQSSNEKRDRSTYYLTLRPLDRKTAILKLTINLPEYFDSSIKAKNLSLCRIQLGDMLKKTKCLERLSADFEIAKNYSKIDVFPETPIPSDDSSYAVVMKIFNPSQAGMYQLNAMAQSPGDLPISGYVGSWNFDIE